MATIKPASEGKLGRWLMYILIGIVIANHLVRLTTGGGEIGHPKSMTHRAGDLPQQALYRVDYGRRKAGDALERLSAYCPEIVEGGCMGMIHGIKVVAGLH